jgi:hypothetical protein
VINSASFEGSSLEQWYCFVQRLFDGFALGLAGFPRNGIKLGCNVTVVKMIYVSPVVSSRPNKTCVENTTQPPDK